MSQDRMYSTTVCNAVSSPDSFVLEREGTVHRGVEGGRLGFTEEGECKSHWKKFVTKFDLVTNPKNPDTWRSMVLNFRYDTNNRNNTVETKMSLSYIMN